MWADLPNVGTSAGGVDDYYPEEIIRIDPDVILCTYPKEMADDIQAKTGIPVVAAPVGTLFQKDYEEAFRLLGDVCGVKDRAEEVITYINNSLDDLANRTASVPDVGKPSVLWAAATFKGAHGIDGVYVNSIIFEKIAAKDVTEGIFDTRSGVVVEKEQILGWNPQYIFFDSGNSQLVRTDFEKDPDFFEILTAVQNGDLYQCPNNTYYYSNLEIPIVNCYYIASLLYPEQFADIDFEEKANEIFKFFLGVDDYLSELEAAGVSYGKVTLGGN
jgi:iron complex transport system substrate-binding protein